MLLVCLVLGFLLVLVCVALCGWYYSVCAAWFGY